MFKRLYNKILFKFFKEMSREETVDWFLLEEENKYTNNLDKSKIIL